MAGLGSLNIAYTGLNAHRKRIDVISENIVNVNTPGYHRQRVELSPISIYHSGFISGSVEEVHGMGVEISEIARIRDHALTANALRLDSRSNEATASAGVLGQLEQIVGGLDDGGLHDQMTDLFNSFDDLASAPEDAAMRQVVLQRADVVGQGFTRTAGDIDDLRARIEADTFDTVNSINSMLAKIAEADKQILSARTVNGDPNTLIDERDVLVSELAKLADVKVVNQSDGQVTIGLDGELLLSNGGFQELAVAYSVDAALTPLGYTKLAVVTQSGRELAPRGGALAAQLTGLQTTIPEARRQLDAVALALHDQVNLIHQSGEGLDNTSANDLFAIGPNTGQLRLSPDVAGQPEKLATRALGAGALDNSNIRRLAELGDDGAGPMASFVEFVGSLAAQVTTANSRASSMEIASEQATAMKQAATGVSLDEELTDLIAAQRSYEASARIMTAIDEALQTLMTTGVVGR